MARTTNFSDLSFGCVLFILKQLKTLEDQVNLARCGQIFRDAFVQLNGERFVEIVDNTIKLKSLEEWRAFLWMCGSRVKRVQVYYDDEHPLQLLPLICKYCTNLESITLHNSTVAKSQPFLLAMPTLKKVHVRNYKSTSKDLIKSMLHYLPNIRSLGLDCFDRNELQELRHFKYLEELQLYDDISASDFVAITRSLANLRVLELRNAKKSLTTHTIRQLAARCQQLEKLSFLQCDAELSSIAQFSHLKYLQLSCPEELKTRLFKALANKCASHLQYLVLHRKRWINEEHARYIGELRALKLLVCKPRTDICLRHLERLTELECLSLQCSRQISELALTNLLRGNERLRYLNICYCSVVTDDFVVDTLHILSKRSAQEPMEMFAAATDIRRDVMERLPADHRLKLLQLNFECSDGMLCDGHYYFDDPEFDR